MVKFLFIFLFFTYNHVACMQKQIISFVNFNKQKHAQYIEEIFSDPEDYKFLEDNYEEIPYKPGLGLQMFELCSGLGEKELGGEGKILEIDEGGLKEFVGFITYFIANNSYNTKMSKGDGCIPIVAIHKKFRGKKLSVDAMNYILTFFKKNQCQKIWLKVHDNNESAKNLYKKFDFEKTNVSTGCKGVDWWVCNLKKQQEQLK